MQNAQPLEALGEAIRLAGSQYAFARICGVTQPAVSNWLRRRNPLPAEHVLPVEEATGVSRHLLRPDIYPEATSHVLPCQEVVEGRAPIVPGDRRAISQCVKS